MKAPLRNRIKGHRRIRLGDLLPHEDNPRIHSPAQREALRKLYEEIGFARSVLAYELPDGRLKLIDGHLRAALTPEESVDVEILDVSEAEARVLLSSIDPLAQLAGYDADAVTRLRRLAEQDSAAVQSLWKHLQEEEERFPQEAQQPADSAALPELFLILIECADEAEQVELLRRFIKEGLKCQAKVA